MHKYSQVHFDSAFRMGTTTWIYLITLNSPQDNSRALPKLSLDNLAQHFSHRSLTTGKIPPQKSGLVKCEIHDCKKNTLEVDLGYSSLQQIV